MSEELILLGIPTYGDTAGATAMANITNLIHGRGIVATASVSAAPFCFNTLWCLALNNPKFTHFLMVHSDISPIGDFITEMMDEMKRLECDVLSAVSPIKSEAGLTSTGIQLPGDGWKVMRLTMKELERFPESFTFPELMINTGCMLVDMRKEWVKSACFKYQDRIVQDSHGQFVPEFLPEDWWFSQCAHRAGAKVYATKKVKLHHIGSMAYPNYGTWGTKETDDRYNLKWEK